MALYQQTFGSCQCPMEEANGTHFKAPTANAEAEPPEA